MRNESQKKNLAAAGLIFLAAYLFLGGAFLCGKVLLPADVLQSELP